MIDTIIAFSILLVVFAFVIFFTAKDDIRLRKELAEKKETMDKLYSYIDEKNKINEWRKEVEKENKKNPSSALSDIINSNNSKLQNDKN